MFVGIGIAVLYLVTEPLVGADEVLQTMWSVSAFVVELLELLVIEMLIEDGG